MLTQHLPDIHSRAELVLAAIHSLLNSPTGIVKMGAESIVCPFCPLCCDDLVVDPAGAVENERCETAAVQFTAAINSPAARIGTETFDHVDWNQFRSSLQLPDSKLPVVEIHGASIEESKAIEDLVRQGAIQLRFDDDVDAIALDQTIARDGMIAATLGDVCSRADFIWIVGDIDSNTPRLRERLNQTDSQIQHSPVLTIDQLSRLHQLTGDDNPSADSDQQLLHRIQHSRYTAIVVGSSPFEENSDVIASELLLKLIVRWNELPNRADDDSAGADGPRVVMLRFSHDQNLRAVMRWRNNHLPSTSLSKPAATTIRIGTQPGKKASSIGIQIGGPDPGQNLAQAYLPAATPGVHTAGTTIRGDGSITLPLVAIATSDQTDRIAVLRSLLEA